MCSKGFSINDLTNMINVLEVCTKRGAFLAQELSGVGSLYDKLRLCRDNLDNLNTEQVCDPGKQNTEICDAKCQTLEEEDENELENCNNCPEKNCDNCPLKEENYDKTGLTSRVLKV